MKTNDFQAFLLKSSVTAMACDGRIDDSEIKEIKNMAKNEVYFMGFDIDQLLQDYLDYITTNGTKAVNEYLNELALANLNPGQELILVEVLINTIEADRKIEDNEIKFLQLVKSKLNTTEQTIITKFPKQINYLIDFNNYGMLKEFTSEIKFE